MGQMCGLGSERERNREEWWYGGCAWLGERVKFTLRWAPNRRSISSKSRAGARTGAKSRRELEPLCFLSVVSFSNAETAEKNKQKEGEQLGSLAKANQLTNQPASQPASS